MTRDDGFKRYQQAGAEFLETARARAEEFLSELARMGDSTQKQAQGTVDDLVDGGRKGTDQILASIRREITAQLSLLGLATKEDLADLERRLTGGAGSGGAPVGPTVVPAPAAAPATASTEAGPTEAGPAEAGPTDAGPTKAAAKKAPAKKAPAKKAPAKKATAEKAPGKKAAPAKKAAGSP